MDKKALKLYIENLINRGSSPAELARRCGVSDTAMSQFRSGKYGANDDNLAAKIASGLYFYENQRNVVPSVTSYMQVKTVFPLPLRLLIHIHLLLFFAATKTVFTCIATGVSFISNAANGAVVSSSPAWRRLWEKK